MYLTGKYSNFKYTIKIVPKIGDWPASFIKKRSIELDIALQYHWWKRSHAHGTWQIILKISEQIFVIIPFFENNQIFNVDNPHPLSINIITQLCFLYATYYGQTIPNHPIKFLLFTDGILGFYSKLFVYVLYIFIYICNICVSVSFYVFLH